MRAWVELYKQHREMRTARHLERQIRERLIKLAKAGVCANNIRGRFTYSKSGNLRRLFIAGNNGNGEPLKLVGIQDARLAVEATINSRNEHVHAFTSMLTGRTGARDWAIAIHLDDDLQGPRADGKGTGACGHAVFHCHVGPDLDALPKVRVALPAVGPVAAFDWLLSQIVPNWEPAPWPDVLDAIDQQGS